jgi:hypothetical protein
MRKAIETDFDKLRYLLPHLCKEEVRHIHGILREPWDLARYLIYADWVDDRVASGTPYHEDDEWYARELRGEMSLQAQGPICTRWGLGLLTPNEGIYCLSGLPIGLDQYGSWDLSSIFTRVNIRVISQPWRNLLIVPRVGSELCCGSVLVKPAAWQLTPCQIPVRRVEWD